MAATTLSPPRYLTRLPELLSLLPRNGVGAIIYQNRWKGKGLPTPLPASASPSPLSPLSSPENARTCFWEVKKVLLSFDTVGRPRARAYGVLTWKGQSPLSTLSIQRTVDPNDGLSHSSTPFSHFSFVFRSLPGKRVTPEDKEYVKITGGTAKIWGTTTRPPLLGPEPEARPHAAKPAAAESS